MFRPYTESAFESAIEEYLVSSGVYVRGDRDAFDRERCLDAGVFLAFVRETQPKEWEYLKGLQKDKAESVLIDDLCRALDSDHQGCLSVLRHGFKCFGKLFRVACFAPVSGMNPETRRLYAANRLTITRQLRYSNRHGSALDVTLGLNGIPVATAELKNPPTGQTWRDAVRQYKHDRDPADLLFQFKKRALVHFAVDPDEVYMTTRLAARNTHFLPFNKGCAGGAGNPENPRGWKTAYLWEEILERAGLLDILARFVHLQTDEKRLGCRKVQRQTVIFPRYHQLDCVRKLVADARLSGAGANYLIQHSAGSGKSNSIAWVAHRLASLYDTQDEKVFDSIIIVTDRLVLDQQLQNTVYQVEHKQGVVQKIDVDSAQHAGALGAGVPIVITTLQKFPFVTEKIGDISRRRYAVIIDEAHSSQGGETATELKGVLGGAALEGLFIDRMEQNDEIAARFINDRDFQDLIGRHLLKTVYEQIRSDLPGAAAAPSGKPGVEPFRRVLPEEKDKYRTCVPLFTLKAAAGSFGAPSAVEPDGWVQPNTRRRLRPGMFVAQVIGRSMEPRIPDGAWCLFQSPVEGTRQGRIVLVQHRDIHDPETGGGYTVKRYGSKKESDGAGGWRHAEIRLLPENPSFAPLILSDVRDDEFHVIAEALEVLGEA